MNGKQHFFLVYRKKCLFYRHQPSPFLYFGYKLGSKRYRLWHLQSIDRYRIGKNE